MEVGVDALNEYVFCEQDETPPYVDDLPSNIGPGTCITVNGFTKPDCSRYVLHTLLFNLIITHSPFY